MRSLLLSIFCLLCCVAQRSQAQNAEFPNALHARFNVNDFGLLSGNDMKLGQGFELAYVRHVAPYLNIGVPFKVDLASLPNLTEQAMQSERSVTSSLDVVFQVMNMKTESKVVPYAFVGGGYFLEEFKDGHFQAPIGVGVNFKVSKYAYVNVQAEFRKAFTDDRDNLHFGAGFAYLLHKGAPPAVLPPDADGDGTPDKLDMCPDQVGPTTAKGCPDRDSDGIGDKEDACPEDAGPAETKGCPDYDADGVADRDDQCPTEPGTVRGCPDIDGDGVVDKDDRCPTQAGPAENNGCPPAKDGDGDGFADENDPCPTTPGPVGGCPDADNDGVADADDRCPNEPGLKTNSGCPATKDSDGDGFDDNTDECPTVGGSLRGCPDRDKDGVADKNDPCPDKAGEFGGCPDTDGDGFPDDKDKCPEKAGPNFGCPEIKKETKERLAFATQAVQFETARTVLKMESYAILDELTGILRQYPDYRLSISGHTDDIGDEARNQRLSEDRAKACYDYFIFRGVKPERLRVAGFGESKPIADNRSSEGRELNRRVEFELTLD